MSLLTAASGQAKATAEFVAKLKPSPAGKLLAGRLKDFLLAKRFDNTLETNVRDIAERIEKEQAADVPAEVRGLLDARQMAIYKIRAARRRGGSRRDVQPRGGFSASAALVGR